jgi:hypothetical protein
MNKLLIIDILKALPSKGAIEKLLAAHYDPRAKALEPVSFLIVILIINEHSVKCNFLF